MDSSRTPDLVVSASVLAETFKLSNENNKDEPCISGERNLIFQKIKSNNANIKTADTGIKPNKNFVASGIGFEFSTPKKGDTINNGIFQKEMIGDNSKARSRPTSIFSCLFPTLNKDVVSKRNKIEAQEMTPVQEEILNSDDEYFEIDNNKEVLLRYQKGINDRDNEIRRLKEEIVSQTRFIGNLKEDMNLESAKNASQLAEKQTLNNELEAKVSALQSKLVQNEESLKNYLTELEANKSLASNNEDYAKKYERALESYNDLCTQSQMMSDKHKMKVDELLNKLEDCELEIQIYKKTMEALEKTHTHFVENELGYRQKIFNCNNLTSNLQSEINDSHMAYENRVHILEDTLALKDYEVNRLKGNITVLEKNEKRLKLGKNTLKCDYALLNYKYIELNKRFEEKLQGLMIEIEQLRNTINTAEDENGYLQNRVTMLEFTESLLLKETEKHYMIVDKLKKEYCLKLKSNEERLAKLSGLLKQSFFEDKSTSCSILKILKELNEPINENNDLRNDMEGILEFMNSAVNDMNNRFSQMEDIISIKEDEEIRLQKENEALKKANIEILHRLCVGGSKFFENNNHGNSVLDGKEFNVPSKCSSIFDLAHSDNKCLKIKPTSNKDESVCINNHTVGYTRVNPCETKNVKNHDSSSFDGVTGDISCTSRDLTINDGKSFEKSCVLKDQNQQSGYFNEKNASSISDDSKSIDKSLKGNSSFSESFTSCTYSVDDVIQNEQINNNSFLDVSKDSNPVSNGNIVDNIPEIQQSFPNSAEDTNINVNTILVAKKILEETSEDGILLKKQPKAADQGENESVLFLSNTGIDDNTKYATITRRKGKKSKLLGSEELQLDDVVSNLSMSEESDEQVSSSQSVLKKDLYGDETQLTSFGLSPENMSLFGLSIEGLSSIFCGEKKSDSYVDDSTRYKTLKMPRRKKRRTTMTTENTGNKSVNNKAERLIDMGDYTHLNLTDDISNISADERTNIFSQTFKFSQNLTDQSYSNSQMKDTFMLNSDLSEDYLGQDQLKNDDISSGHNQTILNKSELVLSEQSIVKNDNTHGFESEKLSDDSTHGDFFPTEQTNSVNNDTQGFELEKLNVDECTFEDNDIIITNDKITLHDDTQGLKTEMSNADDFKISDYYLSSTEKANSVNNDTQGFELEKLNVDECTFEDNDITITNDKITLHDDAQGLKLEISNADDVKILEYYLSSTEKTNSVNNETQGVELEKFNVDECTFADNDITITNEKVSLNDDTQGLKTEKLNFDEYTSPTGVSKQQHTSVNSDTLNIKTGKVNKSYFASMDDNLVNPILKAQEELVDFTKIKLEEETLQSDNYTSVSSNAEKPFLSIEKRQFDFNNENLLTNTCNNHNYTKAMNLKSTNPILEAHENFSDYKEKSDFSDHSINSSEKKGEKTNLISEESCSNKRIIHDQAKKSFTESEDELNESRNFNNLKQFNIGINHNPFLRNKNEGQVINVESSQDTVFSSYEHNKVGPFQFEFSSFGKSSNNKTDVDYVYKSFKRSRKNSYPTDRERLTRHFESATDSKDLKHARLSKIIENTGKSVATCSNISSDSTMSRPVGLLATPNEDKQIKMIFEKMTSRSSQFSNNPNQTGVCETPDAGDTNAMDLARRKIESKIAKTDVSLTLITPQNPELNIKLIAVNLKSVKRELKD